MARWYIRSYRLSAVVEASDQFQAWDVWRAEDRYQFGLIAVAEKDEDGEQLPIQTASLMRRWGRVHDAEAFDSLAREKGLSE